MSTVNPKLMWLGASTMRRNIANPVSNGPGYKTAEVPGVDWPPDEGDLPVVVKYFMKQNVSAEVIDSKSWYNSETQLPATNFGNLYPLNEGVKVEHWVYVESEESVVTAAQSGAIIVALFDLSAVPDEEFPLTVTGQRVKLDGNCEHFETTRKIFGPVSGSTVSDSVEIPLSAKTGYNMFYLGGSWTPAEYLDWITYRMNIKVVGRISNKSMYTGVKFVSCGKQVDYDVSGGIVQDSYNLLAEGMLTQAEILSRKPAMYTNGSRPNKDTVDLDTLLPAFSPVLTSDPATLGLLNTAFPAPTARITDMAAYFEECKQLILGASACSRAAIDVEHCPIVMDVIERYTLFPEGSIIGSKPIYVSPDGSQKITREMRSYGGIQFRGTLGGQLGTFACEVTDMQSLNVGHDMQWDQSGEGAAVLWSRQTVVTNMNLACMVNVYEQIVDPNTPNWPDMTVGKPAMWLASQDVWVPVDDETWEALQAISKPSTESPNTTTVEINSMQEFLQSLAGRKLADTEVNATFTVWSDKVDWDKVRLDSNVEIMYGNDGESTVRVRQVPTTAENLKNTGKLILNIVGTVGALISGAGLFGAVIQYGAGAIGGGNVGLGALNVGYRIYKGSKAVGEAADALWNYEFRENVYSMNDPESIAKLIAEYPQYAANPQQPQSPDRGATIP